MSGAPARGPERRLLGPLDATLLVMGGIIGVGIFFQPGSVALQLRHPALFLGVWALGGLIAAAGAFTFAEWGASLPRAGGWFEYLFEAFGERAAFLFAWVVLFVISTGALAVMGTFCAAMLSTALGAPALEGTLCAALIVLGVHALLLLGVKAGATFQNACMLTKLGAIGVLVVAGCAAAWRGELHPLPPGPEPPPAPPVWRGIVLSLLPVLFTYGGWQMLGYTASEVRDARRTIPRAIVLGVGGVVLCYLLVALDLWLVLGLDRAAAEGPRVASAAARAALGRGGERALAAAMAVSALGVITVTAVATPWIYVAMARRGLFFRSFAALSPRTGAPRLALGLQAALALAYLFAGLRAERWIDHLTGSVVFVEWIFHGLVAYGLLRVRRLRPDLPRPYRSPLYPLFPVAYLVLAALVVGSSLWQRAPSQTWTGLAVLAVGAAVFHVWRRGVPRTAEEPSR